MKRLVPLGALTSGAADRTLQEEAGNEMADGVVANDDDDNDGRPGIPEVNPDARNGL